jgi:hypothetical protein
MPNRLPDDYVPNKVRGFIDQLAYAPDHYKDVMTGMLFVSHVRRAFTTIPHCLATADTPASGKTTFACDIPMMLAYSPWRVGRQTTEPALSHKYLEREVPNLVCDDIGKIFGDSGMNGRNTKIYAILIDCYRQDATTSMSVNRVTQDVPTYGMAFMNGLRTAVPNDLYTRSIWFKMEEAPSGLALRDTLEDSVRADAKILHEAIHAWAGSRADAMTAYMRGPVRFVHPKLEKRKRQIWGPLFAWASCAGGDWPRRIYDAFVTMALSAGEKPVPVAEQRCLLDTADLIMRRGLDRIFLSDLLAALREMPSGNYYREAEDSHLIRRIFPEALGEARVISGTMLYGAHKGQRGRAKGWDAVPVLDAASGLHDMLWPPMETVPDDTEADLAFTPSARAVSNLPGIGVK